MEKREMLEWAIKGLSNEVIKLDTQIAYDKQQLTRDEQGHIILDGLTKTKLRKRLENNITAKEKFERQMFELEFERDLSE